MWLAVLCLQNCLDTASIAFHIVFHLLQQLQPLLSGLQLHLPLGILYLLLFQMGCKGFVLLLCRL